MRRRDARPLWHASLRSRGLSTENVPCHPNGMYTADMLTLDAIAALSVRPLRGSERALYHVNSLLYRATRVRAKVEGLSGQLDSPVVLATNATWKYDFVPLRWALYPYGAKLVTLVKAKYMRDPTMYRVLKGLGTPVILSRGFVITHDFFELFARRPDEAEYRALRRHLDDGVTLPAGEALDIVQTRPRDIMGHRFDPAKESFRDAVHAIYFRALDILLDQSRRAAADGRHVHIYPQGTVSSRLTAGRAGAVQLAWALGLPIVPLGMSGCRDAFPRGGVWPKGGELTFRVGRPWTLPKDALPPTFRPFFPEDEARYKGPLAALTARLMNDINELVEPSYQFAADGKSDAEEGTRRFV